MVQWREYRTCGRVGIHNERLDGRGIYPVCRDRVLYHTCDSSIAWFGYSPHIHPERAAAALTYLVTARTGQPQGGRDIERGCRSGNPLYRRQLFHIHPLAHGTGSVQHRQQARVALMAYVIGCSHERGSR